MDDKTKSILAHITLLGWIIALVMNQSEKGENTSFYLRQNLGFFLVGVAGSVIAFIGLGLISYAVYIVVFVLWILSLVGALSGQKSLTPVVGQMFQDWFKGIS